jgi:eukaryotic-like serine/threonine-protein kinase
MRALKQVRSPKEEGLPLSSSTSRASSPATQASPRPSQDAEERREGRVHKTGDVVDGRYVLIEQLGKGGMGVVWKARSTALDVEVAVKLVRGSNSSSDSFKRMAREAHAAARLGHPAMATVLDFGATPEGDPYVVMELLHGESLGEVLGRERRVDVLRAVGTLLPIIDGLREAHEKGIVHRDLKPENLFISKAARGRLQPKVLDFGIAKLEQPVDSATKLTQDGTVLGSPGYFSPEQARGQTDIDCRTDIWSISVVLYELITGELPFKGANYNALLMSILKDTPPSIMAHGFGDEALWAIVQRGLHRDRGKRWGSMWELGRALAAWLYAKGVHADVASRSIKEVWLDARTASEQAPPPEVFGAEGKGRRALSTLIKRRAADTLAGETVSTASTPGRVPTRLLGWSAAGTFVLVLGWSALMQGRGTSSAYAAAQPISSPELAVPTLEPSVPLASNEPEGPPAPPLSAGSVAAIAMQAKAGSRPAHPASDNNPRSAEHAATVKDALPKVADVVHTRAPEPSAAKAHKGLLPVAPAQKPTKPVARKRIDQEFGF